MDSIMSNIRHKGRASYLTYDKVNEGFVNGEKKVIGKTYAVLNDCALDAVNTICGIVERSQTNLNFELTDNNFYKYVMEDYYVGHSKVHSNGEDEFNEKYGEDLARRFPRLENIYVKAGNPVYDSRNNCNAIIKSENRELYLGGKNTVVPEGVEKIGASAFRDCEGLKSISFPKTLDVIGAYAFSGSHLQTLTLPENLAYVGQEAFYGCDSLLTISLYCSSVVIEQKAFKKCALLKEPDSEVRCYTPYISVPSPSKVFDEGYNCLMIPKGQRSSFNGWEKCFLTIKEMEE